MNRSVRRLPIVVVLVAAAIVAVAIGNATAPTEPVPRDPDTGAQLAAAGTRSSGWFCPGVPVSVPLTTQTLTISNLGPDPADTEVTVYPDDGTPAVTHAVAVGAHFVRRVARADLGPAGGVVVESFSRDVVVEFGVESEEQLAVGPCASVAADNWYFAAGTTGNYLGFERRPVEDWLVLFNPFGTDARVDLTVRTSQDVPEVVKIDVPRRTRVLVPVHERYVRRANVSLAAHTTVGRVVASQSMVFGAESGFTGLTSTLGAVKAAPTWSFGYGAAAPGTRTYIAIVNPGLVDTEADVIVSAATAPLTVPVPRDAVVWVQIGDCDAPLTQGCVAVPPSAPYQITVGSDVDTPILAEQLLLSGESASAEGVATVMGTADPASGAAFAAADLGVAQTSVLAVANPGAVPVTASVFLERDGVEQEIRQDFQLAPGQFAAFDANKLLGGKDAAVVVRASGGIVVTRTLTGDGDVSRSDAIAIRR